MKKVIPWNVPNILTAIRLLAIPIMATFIYLGGQPTPAASKFIYIGFAFFVGIWVTDAVDGFIARRYNLITDFGKIFDPFVDKLFQFTTALMMLIIGWLPPWVLFFILAKEVYIILGGALLLNNRRVVVHSKWYGKLTTVLFVIAFSALFFLSDTHSLIRHLVFVPAAVMALVSCVCYTLYFVKPLESNMLDAPDGQDIK